MRRTDNKVGRSRRWPASYVGRSEVVVLAGVGAGRYLAPSRTEEHC